MEKSKTIKKKPEKTCMYLSFFFLFFSLLCSFVGLFVMTDFIHDNLLYRCKERSCENVFGYVPCTSESLRVNKFYVGVASEWCLRG